MRQLGPYLLSRRIGSGGMAEVWMARRASLGGSKTVAIKLLATNLASKPEYRRMFLEEARLSMLLNNSRLVQVFDAGESGGQCYMAMEWIDGINLAELQTALWERGQRMPVDVAMFIIGEVLRALHYAHNLVHEGASSIVHRDVSPQNVMLSMAGEVKLADFGVARFATEETTGLHVKGKLRYMAPEQLQGSSRDATVDVFAVGAILHEMLEGRKFRGPSSEDGHLLSAILAGEIAELGDAAHVPPELDALRRGMLTPDPNQRTPSALAAVRQLESCPGYRNMSLDLEKLVREHRTIAAGDSSWEQAHAMQEYQRYDTSVSRRSGWGESRRFELGRKQRMGAAVLVALVGLGVGTMSVGMARQARLANEQEPEMAQANVPRMDEASLAARQRVAELERGLESAIARRSLPVVAPVGSESPRAARDEPGSRQSRKSKPHPEIPPPPPVKVKFVAGEFGYLHLKIGSKIHLLEPLKDIDLPPGKYRLRVRKDEAKWQTITVEIPKQPCRVVFEKPHSAKVEPF